MSLPKWVTRLAAASALFFLLKGLVWLAVAGAAIVGVARSAG